MIFREWVTKQEAMNIFGVLNNMHDELNPDYYEAENGMRAIDVIESFDLNFSRGCVVKYTLRAGHKESELRDLKKALWFLKREINRLENEDVA